MTSCLRRREHSREIQKNDEVVRVEARWECGVMLRLRNFVLLAMGFIAISCAYSEVTEGTFITDSDLKIWKNELSPNGNFRIVIYQLDTGGFGYGRVLWTVTPGDINGIDLTKFKLPDGYRAEGWTKESVLQISKWKAYYSLQDNRELRDGDSFNGALVELIENNFEYALPGYEEPTSSR